MWICFVWLRIRKSYELRGFKMTDSFLTSLDFVSCSRVLLNNQRDVALSSRIYSSLQGYSTGFGCFLHPSSGVQLKL
jgi:hypothetical protein